MLQSLFFLMYFYDFELKLLLYATAFGRTDASKETGFYGKICIKACLEIEKTQVYAAVTPKIFIFY